jgi:hypothetical protein
MPKDVPWQGKTVFTGVFKDPVAGPCRARKLNLDGDAHPLLTAARRRRARSLSSSVTSSPGRASSE